MVSNLQKYRSSAYRQFCWQSALSYLVVRTDLEMVWEHMKIVEKQKPSNFQDIYRRMLDSLSNKQGMPNSIGKIQDHSKIFFDFDHMKTLETYPTWESLFDTARVTIGRKVRMEKSDPHNYWVIFCKGSLSAARYLTRFITPTEFLDFVHEFDKSHHTRPALPLLIGQEIFGYKFALACDLLKELGFANFSKPDTHLLDIFPVVGKSGEPGLGISDMSELDVFRTVTMLADEVGETPYGVDKVFWLIGSGDLYLHKKRFPTDKFQFAEDVRKRWDKKF